VSLTARSSGGEFAQRVCALVEQIPYGRVMTYGQIAALAGNGRAARIVGGIAHYGNPDLPWHRVVNRHGGVAAGFPGGRLVQKRLLEDENIVLDDDDAIIDLQAYLWSPYEA